MAVTSSPAQNQFADEIAHRRAAARAELEKVEQRIALLHERTAYLQTVLADCDAADRLLMGAGPEEFCDDETEARAVAHGRLREEIIAVLKAAYPEALKTSQIGSQVAARLGVRFHPKTPGMTLSRLRKEGMADLKGRLWRYVPS